MKTSNQFIKINDDISNIIISSKKLGKVSVIFDTEDFDRVSNQTWTVDATNNRINTHILKIGQKVKINLTAFLLTDFNKSQSFKKDGNPFNFCKSNLIIQKENEYIDVGNGTTILNVFSIERGQFSYKIDTDQVSKIKQCSWWRHKVYGNDDATYAYSTVNGENVSLHRFLMGCPPSDVDHINGDHSDNRVSNLRITSIQGNNQNSSYEDKRGLYRGVYYFKRVERYTANYTLNGKYSYAGIFKNKYDAGIAASEARLKHMEYIVPEREYELQARIIAERETRQ